MGEKTKKIIAAEIQKAKHFSVIVDSTPDLSHVDHLTFIFRFISAAGKVVMSFLGSEPLYRISIEWCWTWLWAKL